MVREQITHHDFEEKVLSEEELRHLGKLRQEGIKLLQLLREGGFRNALTHGSVARGDVSLTSDLDVLVETHSSYNLEFVLGEHYVITERMLVQATPNHTPKAVLSVGAEVECHVVFPLVPLRTREEDFYKFGGAIGLEGLSKKLFVPGVNKKLQLVEKVDDRTFLLIAVAGREHVVAQKLRIGVETVEERVRVLSRRASVGRTGVFLRRFLSPEEQFEMVLRETADSNPAVRRFLQTHAKGWF